jgi:PAS domain S-box-containing protein
MTDDREVGADGQGMEPRTPTQADATALADRTAGLERATSVFAADLSRAVRTPLLLLLGPLHDILDSPASALAPASRTALDATRRNAVRLLQLLDALPEFAWTGSAAVRAARGPGDLASFTAALAESFRPACDAAGLRLVVDCAPMPDRDAVDRDAWEKIVLNLVANAFKSTVEGTIDVRLRDQAGAAQLTVADTGVGIAERELHYVFARFDRTGSRADGAGRVSYGLPFVRDLVRRHNGSIDVHSTLGRGTTFSVRLPLARQDGPADAARQNRDGDTSAGGADAGASTLSPTGEPVARSRGHVVIAEDHDETRDYLCHVLETAGFAVEAMADGRAALATCQMRAPDVVVSDVLMPGLDGFELIERLRGSESTAVIPVLLLSARGGEDSRIEGISSGADDYLVKPLSSRELVARVDGAVRLGRLRRETARREQADLDALFSMAPDGLIVVGRNGNILTANEQARKLFGYSAQELQSLQVEALMPAAHRKAHVDHRDTYKRAPLVRLMNPMQELRGVRSDGTEFSAEIALGPLQFKNQACTIAIVRDISERKKLEAERAEQERRFRELSSRLVEVQEAERRQLSTELHDRTSPQLAAIQINLKMLGHLVGERETEDVRALLDDTVQLIADTTGGIREISSNLRPAVLDDGGLLPALAAYTQQFAQRTGIAVHLHTDEATGTLAPGVQSSVFRIVQEALTNCVKHAKARHVTIRLSTGDGHLLTLAIADDGVGFDVESQSSRGLGLLTMRERAEFLGGRFSLHTRPGHGTRIVVVV